MTRRQLIPIGLLVIVGTALMAWAVVLDHGMGWGVFGAIVVGWAATTTVVILFHDENREVTGLKTVLFLLSPVLCGGLFAAGVKIEQPDPIPGEIVAHDGSAVGFYGREAVTWSWEGLAVTSDNGDPREVGEKGIFFDPPIAASEKVLVGARGKRVIGYAPKTGRAIWTREIEQFEAFQQFGDLLVYRGSKTTAALSLATGKDAWRAPGSPTLATGGLAITGTSSWWDLYRHGGQAGKIAPGAYIGLVDDGAYLSEDRSDDRLEIIEVATGRVVRQVDDVTFNQTYAITDEFLYLERDGRAEATPLVGSSVAREVRLRPHQDSDDLYDPDHLFESKYPGFLGAMPDGWTFPDEAEATIVDDRHGWPVFPVSDASGRAGVWFTGSTRVTRIDDSFDKLLGSTYDRGTYVQLVTDRDAVGRRTHRLDVVRGSTVQAYLVPSDDGGEGISLRDGLMCLGYDCRRIDDLLR